MRVQWAVPVLASVLILGTLGLTPNAFSQIPEADLDFTVTFVFDPSTSIITFTGEAVNNGPATVGPPSFNPTVQNFPSASLVPFIGQPFPLEPIDCDLVGEPGLFCSIDQGSTPLVFHTGFIIPGFDTFTSGESFTVTATALVTDTSQPFPLAACIWNPSGITVDPDSSSGGADCSQIITVDLTSIPQCDAETTCNGNGFCDANDSCVCNLGFGGANCNACENNFYPAFGNANACSTFCLASNTSPTPGLSFGCSSHGTCSPVGACQCFQDAVNGFFTGANCSQCEVNFYPASTCTTFCEPSTTCNGNGVCDPTGSCICDEGFSGDDCSIPGFCVDPQIGNSNSAACDGTPTGQTCDAFRCDSGFEPSGSAPTCQGDGTWDNIPTCEPLFCPICDTFECFCEQNPGLPECIEPEPSTCEDICAGLADDVSDACLAIGADEEVCDKAAEEVVDACLEICEPEPEKVTLCHKGKNTLSVASEVVPAHLAHGDTLEACE